MTEKFWQQEKERIRKNKDNVHPIIQQTYDDKQSLVPNKNFRELYYNCLQGSLNVKAWEQSDDMSIDDMGMLICRDVGCELQYCQASMSDPYENPFENCDEHVKKFFQCQHQEKRRYAYDNQGRSMQEQIAFMLEKKRIEKARGVAEFVEQNNKQQQKEIVVNESENLNSNRIVIEQKL